MINVGILPQRFHNVNIMGLWRVVGLPRVTVWPEAGFPEMKDVGGGSDCLFGVVTEVGIGIEAHFLAIKDPGVRIELKQAGVDVVFGFWIEVGFTECNVPDDIWVDGIEDAIVIGKAVNLLRGEDWLEFWSRGWFGGRFPGGGWSESLSGSWGR